MDLTAARAFVRFLIRDPNGRAISDTDLRDIYLNPAADEWWARFERRPGSSLVSLTYTANATSYDVGLTGIVIDPATRIEAVELVAGTAQLRRSEWNVIRALQESEGATGTPINALDRGFRSGRIEGNDDRT